MGLRVAGLVLVVLSHAACSRDSTANVRRYQLTGVVTGHESSPPRVVISHDAVGELMPAMSMAFEVKTDAPSLREGDRIVSTLVVTEGRSWLENVRITGRASDASSPLPALGRATVGHQSRSSNSSIRMASRSRFASSLGQFLS
jgi:Cu/Ag efflux protein CusF